MKSAVPPPSPTHTDSSLFSSTGCHNPPILSSHLSARPFFAQAETQEHGWPSFRAAEVIAPNVLTLDDGVTVVSACGTKLGTNEADETGDRFCMDLVCISGSP